MEQTAVEQPEGLIVQVVVVNMREADLTIGCLGTLDAEMRQLPGLRVYVADNNSCDGSEIGFAKMDALGSASAGKWCRWGGTADLRWGIMRRFARGLRRRRRRITCSS